MDKQEKIQRELLREMRQIEDQMDDMSMYIKHLTQMQERCQEAEHGVRRCYSDALYGKTDYFYQRVNHQFEQFQDCSLRTQSQLDQMLEASKREVSRLRYDSEDCSAKMYKP